VAMVLLARVNPNFLRRSTPWLYAAGCVLLLMVAAIGHVGLGAQRWLNLGLFRFQPSELMKLAVPMTWIIDSQGVVRARLLSAVTEQTLSQAVLPLLPRPAATAPP